VIKSKIKGGKLMAEYKEILVEKTPRWVKILMVILFIGNIVGWSSWSGHLETINEYGQQVEDLQWENQQLRQEVESREADISLLEDDLRALGYRPVDLSTIEVTSRRNEFITIADDSSFWNKRQDIDKFLENLLSRTGIISEYDIGRAFASGGTWDAIDLTKSYWEKLKDNGIISVIVVGNLDLHGETFSECNHSWLLVFYTDWESDGWSKTKPLGILIFEPTQRYSFVIHIVPEASIQYQEGYFYISPSELEADIEGQ